MHKASTIDRVIVSREPIVPPEESLLERSRTQWQFGDWDSLVKLNRDTLEQHSDRAKLALLAAAGHLQTNNLAEARHFIRLAQDWGCSKKLVSQILLSSVHNTLGRVAAIAGKTAHAIRNFEAAIAVGMPGSDVRLIMPVRIGQQFTQMGLPMPVHMQQALTLPAMLPAGNHLEKGGQPPVIQRCALHDLGNAWAANTVNTVIFRHHGILTCGHWQFTAFYADKNTLRVVQRSLVDDAIATTDLPGQYNLCDAHNSISLGADRDGFLHISYDHHGTQLRYRRATKPHSIESWTEELSMTGVYEEKVTYPNFIVPYRCIEDDASSAPLLLLYRDGNWKKGSARLKRYDEGTKSWTDFPGPILSGADQAPWTSNAYWNHPVTGSDGSLHLSFVWRTDSIGDEALINNINVCYARSLDNGATWHTSHGRPYRLPITQVNAETIYPVSPGRNLMNQTSMALDSQNHPHIVFYSDDPDGIPQYQHVWFDGKAWRHQFISQRTAAFSLRGGGTLQIPISRPEIVIDQKDNVYVIFRGDLTDNRMAITRLSSPDFNFAPGQTAIVWDEDLGYAEPVIDRSRWQKESILTLLLQHNSQPDGDKVSEFINRPVTLIDLRLC